MNLSYTLREVADLLNCSANSVYNYHRKGLLKRFDHPDVSGVAIHFYREEVIQLLAAKERMETKGKTITQVAETLGVHFLKVKEAIEVLQLDVEKVPTSLGADSNRYTITAEQENRIGDYMKSQKLPRPKRNYFYFASVDVALNQAFLLEGKETVRIQLKDRLLGFAIGERGFIPYLEALKTMAIKPLYKIHQPNNRELNGFMDFDIPVESELSDQVLDTLYAVCGVENFHVEARGGRRCFSVRNGRYPINSWATAERLAAIKQYIPSGKMECMEGFLHFNRSTTSIQLEFETEEYASIEKAALKAGISPKEWIRRAIKTQEDAFGRK